MELVLDNHLITTPMINILTKLKIDSKGYLQDIKQCGDEIKITCPFHKGGQERNPSCFVRATSSGDVEYGVYHCFTCGESGSLVKLVSQCLRCSYQDGKQWIIDNFGDTFVEQSVYIPDISLSPVQKKYIDPNILLQYDFYHPYMWFRGLSKEVVDTFRIGYDKTRNAITFPVWDIHNNLVMITARCVDQKKFYIDKDIDKPVYLLNFIQQWGIDKVVVCESQINALYCWSMGYPAIALIGTGSAHQYDILNKSCIRSYVLAFDGDAAGDNGRKRFMSNIRKDVFISTKVVPEGKDVNNLTKEEFENLPII